VKIIIIVIIIIIIIIINEIGSTVSLKAFRLIITVSMVRLAPLGITFCSDTHRFELGITYPTSGVLGFDSRRGLGIFL
jgi:hypothetical protein